MNNELGVSSFAFASFIEKSFVCAVQFQSSASVQQRPFVCASIEAMGALVVWRQRRRHHVKMRNFEHSPAFLVFLLVPCVWRSVLCLLNNTKIGHWAFVGCRIAIHGCITRICDVMWSGRRDSHQYHAVQMTTANSCCCCRRHHRKAYFYRTPEMKQKKKREIHRRLNKQNVLAIEGAVVEVEQLGVCTASRPTYTRTPKP